MSNPSRYLSVLSAAVTLVLSMSTPADCQPVRVRTSVSYDPVAGDVVYEYRISGGRTGVASVQLSQVPEESVDFILPAGWTSVQAVPHAGRAPALSASPQQAELLFTVRSPLLPAMASLRIFSAEDPSSWNEAIPVEAISILAPMIGTAPTDVPGAAADLIEQTMFRLLVMTKDSPGTAELWSTLDRARNALERVAPNTIEAIELLRGVSDTGGLARSADRGQSGISEAVRFNIDYVARMLQSGVLPTWPGLSDVRDEWTVWTDTGVSGRFASFASAISASTVGFVGTLVENQPAFEEDVQEVRTRMVFEVKERLFGAMRSDETTRVTVRMRGGTARHTLGETIPDLPALLLPTGTPREFVVIADRFDGPGARLGQLWIRATDFFAAIFDARTVALSGNQIMFGELISSARARSADRLQGTTDTRIVLDALRALGREAEHSAPRLRF